MKPEEFLDPEKLPEDLQWLAVEHRLHPDDPLFIVLAWHHAKTLQGEEKLKSALMELKTGVDGRIASLEKAADTVATVKDQLSSVQTTLAEKPFTLAKQLEVELQKPVRTAVEQIQGAEKSLAGLLRAADTTLATAQRRQALASFVVGVVLGASLLGLALLP